MTRDAVATDRGSLLDPSELRTFWDRHARRAAAVPGWRTGDEVSRTGDTSVEALLSSPSAFDLESTFADAPDLVPDLDLFYVAPGAAMPLGHRRCEIRAIVPK